MSQTKLLKTAQEVLVEQQEDIGGYLMTITSDGDSRRRQSAGAITLTHVISHNKTVQKALSELHLFNMEVGPRNVNADIEYKHLIKRERNSLLQNKGVTIHGVLINAAVLK